MNIRYLACITPGDEFLTRLEEGLRRPRCDLHATLYVMEGNREDEQRIIDALNNIRFTPFTTRTTGTALYGRDAYAVTLEKPDTLQRLHDDVVEAMKPYSTDEGFQQQVLRYTGKNYSPHITISRGQKPKKEYSGIEIPIKEFSLLKKERGEWRDAATLTSRE